MAGDVARSAWRNRRFIRSYFNAWRAYRRPRPADAPGARGSAYTPGGGGSGTAKFKRAWNKLGAFRSVPSINSTHLDLHSSMSFVLKAGLADANSYHHFIAPLEINALEPFSLSRFTIQDLLSVRSKMEPADLLARGYPCNQLLTYYNNFVVTGADVKIDVRVVERVPGGAASVAGTWLQTGQVTVPVNIACIRVTESELHYLVNELPGILKETTANNHSFDGEELSKFDRVLREQFGVCPLNMGTHRKEGVVATKWNAAVADECKKSDVIEDIGDHYGSGTPANGHIGVTEGTTLVHSPTDTHYLLIVGWFNPTSLGEYLDGRPNDREVELVLDTHIRQFVTLGDVVETSAGISSGPDVVSRSAPVAPVQPPGLKRS